MQRIIGLVVTALFVYLSPGIAQEQPDLSSLTIMHGNVVDVINGKTLMVTANGVQEEVVLIGVLTPAELHPDQHALYRKKVLSFLKKFAKEKSVKLRLADPARNKQKQLQAYVVRKQDNLMINFAVIRMGFGHAVVESDYVMKRHFRNAESDARKEGLGLWGRSLKTIHKEGKAAREKNVIGDENAKVYLTVDDRKYHRDYCRQLQQTRYPFKLKDAKKAGYEPCKICLPPK